MAKKVSLEAAIANGGTLGITKIDSFFGGLQVVLAARLDPSVYNKENPYLQDGESVEDCTFTKVGEQLIILNFEPGYEVDALVALGAVEKKGIKKGEFRSVFL